MTTKTNLVLLDAFRKAKAFDNEDLEYRARILGMDKLALLEEMVRFQEERTKLGHLTLEMMVRGKHLFKALEDSSETQEMRLLTRSYRRHLELELQDYLKSNQS